MYIYNIFNICNILRYLKFIFSKHKYLKCKCNYFFKSKCNYFFRRNGAGLVGNKRVQNAALGCSLINSRMTSVHFLGKPFNITVILVYAPNTTAKVAEVDPFYEDLQDLLYLTLKKKRQGKDFLFIIKNWNAKGGSQEISRIVRKFGLVVQSEAGPRLTEFCQENMVVIEDTL